MYELNRYELRLINRLPSQYATAASGAVKIEISRDPPPGLGMAAAIGPSITLSDLSPNAESAPGRRRVSTMVLIADKRLGHPVVGVLLKVVEYAAGRASKRRG